MTLDTTKLQSRLDMLFWSTPKMKSPYDDLLHRLLHARIIDVEDMFNTRNDWLIERLELKFSDTFRFLPPTSLAELYQLCLCPPERPRLTLIGLAVS
jgi:hypothetical protein